MLISLHVRDTQIVDESLTKITTIIISEFLGINTVDVTSLQLFGSPYLKNTIGVISSASISSHFVKGLLALSGEIHISNNKRCLQIY